MTSLLIAEDQEWTRKGLREMIEQQRLDISEIMEASDGLAALRTLQDREVNIVLTDIRMPGMDGLQLSQAVKERYPDTKVVILSGFNEFSYAQQALRCGVSEYLLKPVHPEALQDVLGSAIAAVQESRKQDEALQQLFLQRILEAHTADMSDCPDLPLETFEANWKRVLVVPDASSAVSGDSIRNIQLSFRRTGIGSAALRQTKGWLLLLGSEHEISKDDVEAVMTQDSLPADDSQAERRFACSSLYRELPLTSLKELEAILALHLNATEPERELLAADALALTRREDEMRMLMHAIEQHDIVSLHKWLKAVFPEGTGNRELVRTGYALLQLMAGNENDNTNWHYGIQFLLKPLQKAIRLTAHNRTHPISAWLREAVRHSFEMTLLHLEKKDLHLIQWCQTYIVKNINNDVSLSTLAEKLHFSPSHLSNLFKQVTNRNYIDFVSDIKISKAKHYLTDTNLRIQDIANHLGYTDTKYFSKWFRRYTGLTPSEFKQKMREARV